MPITYITYYLAFDTNKSAVLGVENDDMMPHTGRDGLAQIIEGAYKYAIS